MTKSIATPAVAAQGTRHRYDPMARRRGTRGFAAFVTLLAGLVSLAVGLVAIPAAAVDRVAVGWIVILATAFGIAHLVAVVGLVRGRRWSGNVVAYLAAIGIGVSAYGLLVTLSGLDPFGATSALPAGRARADGIGLLIWMIGLWLVAARFAWRGSAVAGPAADPADDPSPVAAPRPSVIRPRQDMTFAG